MDKVTFCGHFIFRLLPFYCLTYAFNTIYSSTYNLLLNSFSPLWGVTLLETDVMDEFGACLKLIYTLKLFDLNFPKTENPFFFFNIHIMEVAHHLEFQWKEQNEWRCEIKCGPMMKLYVKHIMNNKTKQKKNRLLKTHDKCTNFTSCVTLLVINKD